MKNDNLQITRIGIVLKINNPDKFTMPYAGEANSDMKNDIFFKLDEWYKFVNFATSRNEYDVS